MIASRDYSRISYATSPVRIDLSGGWSDTPPISYEYPGSVSNSFIIYYLLFYCFIVLLINF